MDWMAAAWRDRAEQPWQLAYRFRCYRDDKVHESEDVKNWYTGEADRDAPIEVIIETMNKVASALPGVREKHFVDMRGLGIEEQTQRLLAAPWSHVRTTAAGGSA
jgi:hypothetical protein